MAVLLTVLVGCASAPPQAAPVAVTRPVDPDVVDIRGIWEGTRLDPKGAAERGLDSAAVVTPQKVRTRAPIYPREALDAHVTGTVTLECLIEVAGQPADCMITGGPAQLHRAALDAVAAWRWQPLTVGGVPKRALVQLTVSFKIS